MATDSQESATPPGARVTALLLRLAPALAVAAAAALLLPRLSHFGVWDPWELEIAERARTLSPGSLMPRPALSTWLSALGFSAFGFGSLGGRLATALCAVASVGAMAGLGGLLLGRRAALYAPLVLATSAGFILNARTMFGAAGEVLAQLLLALPAAYLLHPGRPRRRVWAVGAGLGLALLLTTFGSGVLRGALPLLWATALTPMLTGGDGPNRTADGNGWPQPAALAWALPLTAFTAWAIVADQPGHAWWTGGPPQGLQAPTFDRTLQAVFHGFSPWSALLPVALAGALWGELDGPRRRAATWALAWLGGGYAAHAIYLARYGDAAFFVPWPALCLLVALWLERVEARATPDRAAAIAVTLAGLLLVRDHAMYPEGPLAVIPLAGLDLPDGFDMARSWSALAVLFTLAAVVTLVAGQSRPRPSPRALLDAVVGQWRSGHANKLWLLTACGLLAALVGLGVLAHAAPAKLHLSTLGGKWLRRAVVLPLVLAALPLALPWLLYWLSRLRHRTLPVWLAAACVALFAAQVYLPELSRQLSPRSAYETYDALAGPNEPLAEYEVGSRSGSFYAKGEVVEVKSLMDVVKHLDTRARTWATLPAAQLVVLDRAYRKRTGRHVYVADARSAKVVLVASQPVRGHADQNVLRHAVRDAPPTQISHPLDIRFGQSIELLGYDLSLPHDTHVGAGERFEIVWYFRALRSQPGSYKAFVHIDGPGRINGDHVPVDGKYPVKLWQRGDVIVDRQRIDVPASTQPGVYRIYIGFFRGSVRMPVADGKADSERRVEVGRMRVR